MTELEQAHIDGLAVDNQRLAGENEALWSLIVDLKIQNREACAAIERLQNKLATQEKVSSYWRRQVIGGAE